MKALPDIMQTLYAIHQVDVQNWHGFGWFDDHGIGIFSSWKDFLAGIIEEERPDGFYGKWHILFRTTFLDRNFFERVYRQMLRLSEKCPEKRYLVHGGYGYNNVLAHEGRVTAVLDWIDAMYGDFVYDIAGLDEWPPFGLDFPELLYQYYTSRGVSLLNYRERVVCYRLRRGLDGMRFFAKTNNQEAYQWVSQKLEKLLTTS
jgi:hygromycin-B 4-O-kinase